MLGPRSSAIMFYNYFLCFQFIILPLSVSWYNGINFPVLWNCIVIPICKVVIEEIHLKLVLKRPRNPLPFIYNGYFGPSFGPIYWFLLMQLTIEQHWLRYSIGTRMAWFMLKTVAITTLRVWMPWWHIILKYHNTAWCEKMGRVQNRPRLRCCQRFTLNSSWIYVRLSSPVSPFRVLNVKIIKGRNNTRVYWKASVNWWF